MSDVPASLDALNMCHAQRAPALCTVLQVSDYLEFGKEDTQEEKAAALASVISVGEHVWVKCAFAVFSLCTARKARIPTDSLTLRNYDARPMNSCPCSGLNCLCCRFQGGRGVVR